MTTAPETGPRRGTATKTKAELRVVNQAWLKPGDIGTVKYLWKVAGLLYLKAMEDVVRQVRLIPVECIIEVRRSVPFDIIVATLTKTTLHVPKHMETFATEDSMVNIIDPGEVHKELRHSVATVQPEIAYLSESTCQYREQQQKLEEYCHYTLQNRPPISHDLSTC